MKKENTLSEKGEAFVGADFFEEQWGGSWTYIRTVVDVVHEPMLILDKNFRVIAANESFYRTFQVEEKETEKKIVYDLGDGQWNIPSLRKLLQDILPKNTFFKGFEVAHDFPSIGRKVMILNARQIYLSAHPETQPSPSIILLAMEDITEMVHIAETFAEHNNKFEARLSEHSERADSRIKRLEKEVRELKKEKD